MYGYLDELVDTDDLDDLDDSLVEQLERLKEIIDKILGARNGV